MSATSEVRDRAQHRPHPPMPLSANTTRRLLLAMLDRAERGDNDAAERLIRLAREQRRTATAAQ